LPFFQPTLKKVSDFFAVAMPTAQGTASSSLVLYESVK
jgi:hypothetical protein